MDTKFRQHLQKASEEVNAWPAWKIADTLGTVPCSTAQVAGDSAPQQLTTFMQHLRKTTAEVNTWPAWKTENTLTSRLPEGGASPQ